MSHAQAEIGLTSSVTLQYTSLDNAVNGGEVARPSTPAATVTEALPENDPHAGDVAKVICAPGNSAPYWSRTIITNGTTEVVPRSSDSGGTSHGSASVAPGGPSTVREKVV